MFIKKPDMEKPDTGISRAGMQKKKQFPQILENHV